MIKCERGITNLLRMQQKTATNTLWYGECLCLLHYKHLYSWWRITQKIYIPSKIQKISQWNRCSTYLKSWKSDNQMRFMEWVQLIGKILHGNNYLWLVKKKSSVSRTRRFTYFQILCYAFERWTRTHNQIMHGKTGGCGSKVHQNTELWTQLMVSQWDSCGILSQHSPHCSSATKSKSSCLKWAIHHTLKDGSSSCRCSVTSNGDLKTPGRWSFLGPGPEKKWYSTHGSRPQREWDRVIDDDKICRKRTPSFPCHESTVPRNAQKQRWWKIINTLLRWWRNDWNCFSHNYFC